MGPHHYDCLRNSNTEMVLQKTFWGMSDTCSLYPWSGSLTIEPNRGKCLFLLGMKFALFGIIGEIFPDTLLHGGKWLGAAGILATVVHGITNIMYILHGV